VFGTLPSDEGDRRDVSVVFVPPKFAKDAIIEAVDARSRFWWSSPRESGAGQCICVGYNVNNGQKTRIIGPNCPGIITRVRRLPASPLQHQRHGPVGLVSSRAR